MPLAVVPLAVMLGRNTSRKLAPWPAAVLLLNMPAAWVPSRCPTQPSVTPAPGIPLIRYDALVLSPGAFAIKPPLPGIDLPGIFQMKTIPDT